MKKNMLTASISAVIICGLTFTALPASASSTTSQYTPSTIVTSEVQESEFTDAEIDQLAQDLEALFTAGFTQNPDGSFTVNEANIISHFGLAQGSAIISEFRQQIPKSGPGQVMMAKASYGKCVLNFTGFGAIFGASEGTILGYINRKDWNKAAQTMAKFLGKQALKGGVVGLAASLAAAGAWCLTPWSR